MTNKTAVCGRCGQTGNPKRSCAYCGLREWKHDTIARVAGFYIVGWMRPGFSGRRNFLAHSSGRAATTNNWTRATQYDSVRAAYLAAEVAPNVPGDYYVERVTRELVDVERVLRAEAQTLAPRTYPVVRGDGLVVNVTVPENDDDATRRFAAHERHGERLAAQTTGGDVCKARSDGGPCSTFGVDETTCEYCGREL